MPEIASTDRVLRAHWAEPESIVNLRGLPDDAAFLAATTTALGRALPLEPCRTVGDDALRIVWAGPDDWFVIEPAGTVSARLPHLRQALAGLHAALTDVGSGYGVLRLSGAAVRDVLAQGCPLDLDPEVFGPGHAAGTHFFKASVWLWRPGEGPEIELLVRRSFQRYVQAMLTRCTLDVGIVSTGAVPEPG